MEQSFFNKEISQQDFICRKKGNYKMKNKITNVFYENPSNSLLNQRPSSITAFYL